MESGIEDVIRSVIHIDKGAVHMKEDVDSQIAEKRKAVAGQVSALKESIVEERKAQANLKKKAILKEVQKEADDIVKESRMKADKMQEAYDKKKQSFIEDMFHTIFMTK